jgi:hypothetical protein
MVAEILLVLTDAGTPGRWVRPHICSSTDDIPAGDDLVRTGADAIRRNVSHSPSEVKINQGST